MRFEVESFTIELHFNGVIQTERWGRSILSCEGKPDADGG